MNAELSTRSIIIILVIFGSMAAGWFTLRQEAQSIRGPTHMHLDPGGQVYIRVADRLFRYAPDGSEGGQYDLAAFGAGSAGDFAFFPDGDILLARRADASSILERIGILLGIADRTESDAAAGGLLRCDLHRKRCKTFTDEVSELGRAFYFYIDPVDSSVYLSRPVRHDISKFDSEGRLLARVENGLRFPNQIRVRDGRLYVANTDRHEIRIVSAEKEDFGRRLKSIDVEASDKIDREKKWPVMFEFVGDRIWVNSFRRNLEQGSIYVFAGDGRFLNGISSQRVKDPFSMVSFDNRVLVGDTQGFAVHEFDAHGQRDGVFQGGALEAFLQERERRHAFYKRLADIVLILFWVAVAAGLFIGFRQVSDSDELRDADRVGELSVDINNPNIVWIEPTRGFVRRIRLAKVVLIGVALLLLLMSLFMGSGPMLLLSLAMVLVAAVVAVSLGRLADFKIGTINDVVILKKGDRYVAGKGEQISFSGNHIVIGNLSVLLSNEVHSVFSRKQLIDHVYPLLKEARELSNIQMLVLLARKRDGSFIFGAVALASVVVVYGLIEAGLI